MVRDSVHTKESETLTAIRPTSRIAALQGAVFETALAVWSFVYGILVLSDHFLEDFHPTGRIGMLAAPFTWAMGLLFLTGATAVLVSFLCRRRTLGELMSIERIGLSLLGGAWLAYGIGVLTAETEDITAWSSAIAVVGALAIRWTAVRREAQIIRGASRARREEGKT